MALVSKSASGIAMLLLGAVALLLLGCVALHEVHAEPRR